MNAQTPSTSLRVESKTQLWRSGQIDINYVFLYRYQDNMNADWWWRLTAPTADADAAASWIWWRGLDPVLDHLLDQLVDLSWRETVDLGAYGKNPGPVVVDALRRFADARPHAAAFVDRFANFVLGTTTVPPADSRAYSSTY